MKTHSLVLTLACVTSVAAVAAPLAQGEPFGDRARVLQVRPIHERIPVTREECWNDRQRTYEERRVTRTDTGAPIGAGTVLGAVIGGVVGHQFGSGRGQDAETAAGAAGGAIAGHEMEKQRNAGSFWRVMVDMDRGLTEAIDVADPGGLRRGDRVKVIGRNIHRIE